MSIFDIVMSPIFTFGILVKSLYVFLAATVKATILFAFFLLCDKRTWLKVIYWTIIAIYTILSLINLFGFIFYGFGLTRKLILIFAQTTPAEIANFMPGLWDNLSRLFAEPVIWLMVALVILLLFAVGRCSCNRIKSFITATNIAGITAIAIYCFCFPFGRTAHIMAFRLLKYSIEIYSANNEYLRLAAQKKTLPDAHTAISRYYADNVVVIIGESASRNHHSIYGYKLPTTPRIEEIKDSIFIFRNVIGSSQSTAGNMERILSFKEDDMTYNDGLRFPLLIDTFRQMGYKTFWYSNQERTGTISNTSGIMAMSSDVVEYLGADNSEDALAFKHDEIVLPAFHATLKDTAAHKIIFIHLLGSHVEYKHRYPARFNSFTAEDELAAFPSLGLSHNQAKRRAEYDNSILYTDYILADITNKIMSLKEPSIAIYLSDHGENVYDEAGYSGRSERFVEVPFFICANRSYKQNHPQLCRQIERALEKPMSTANLAHLLLSLTGSDYKAYNPQLDIISSEYRIKPRYVDEKIWTYENQH